MRGIRRGLALLATGTVLAGTAAAQSPQAQLPPGAVVQPLAQDDGAELRGYLTTLADNPRSVDALVGAGRAALGMGDWQAAVTFFGRANELARRDPRVRAGMGSALVHLGEPEVALGFFAEAVGLGAPEIEIAADRGLAFDLVGNPRRAQQDYLLALRRADDAELRRRLALSLAISGRRDAALRLIDEQLRSHDRAAWRTQAFVLALTGDAQGAHRTARGVMPPADAEALRPFLQRLAALNPTQQAMAVHLGRFANGGNAVAASAPVDTTADPAAVALAMGGAPAATPSRTETAEASTAGRRRPAAERDSSDRYGLREAGRSSRRRTAASSVAARRDRGNDPVPPAQARSADEQASTPAPREADRPTERADAGGRWSGAPYTPSQPRPSTSGTTATNLAAGPPASAAPQRQRPSPQVEASDSGVAARPSVSPDSVVPASGPIGTSRPPLPSPPRTESSGTVRPTEIAPSSVEASPGFSLQPSAAETAPDSQSEERRVLADIAELVRSLPREEAQRRSSPPARPAPTTRPAPAPPAATRPARSSRPAHPARHWVQIAGGANRAALPREFARLRAQAPDQLNGRTAYTTPLRATNRLLVGPFDSEHEAQEFVNQLAGREVAAFAWTSEAGQEIERLPTGR